MIRMCSKKNIFRYNATSFRLAYHSSLSSQSSLRYRAYVRLYTSSPRPLNPNFGFLSRPSFSTKSCDKRNGMPGGVDFDLNQSSSVYGRPRPSSCGCRFTLVPWRLALLPTASSNVPCPCPRELLQRQQCGSAIGAHFRIPSLCARSVYYLRQQLQTPQQ